MPGDISLQYRIERNGPPLLPDACVVCGIQLYNIDERGDELLQSSYPYRLC